MTKAVGRSFFVDRVQLSFRESLHELRIRIDEIIERPPSGGLAQYKLLNALSATAIVLGIPLTTIWFFVREQPVQECFGILSISVGFAGMIYGWNVLTLPARFWDSDRIGNRLRTSLGFRSTWTLRWGAFFFLTCSLLLLIGGVFLLSN